MIKMQHTTVFLNPTNDLKTLKNPDKIFNIQDFFNPNVSVNRKCSNHGHK